MNNEPIFEGLVNLTKLMKPVVDGLTRANISLPADQTRLLKSLLSKESNYSLDFYFSASRKFLPASADQQGKANSPLRSQGIEQAFRVWCDQLAKDKTPFRTEYYDDLYVMSDQVDPELWGRMITPPPEDQLEHNTRDAFKIDPAPWETEHVAFAIVEPMIRFRADIINQVSRLSAGPNYWKDKNDVKSAKEASSIMTFLKAHSYLPFKTASEKKGEDAGKDDSKLNELETDPAIFWEKFLSQQPNPFFASQDPASVLKTILPYACWHQIVRSLADVAPAIPEPRRLDLAKAIWKDAAQSVANTPANEPVMMEEAILAGALRNCSLAPGGMPEFTHGMAYALSTTAGLGSVGGFREGTKDRRDLLVKTFGAPGSVLSDMLMQGRASIVVQCAAGWPRQTKTLESTDTRLKGLSSRLTVTEADLSGHDRKTSAFGGQKVLGLGSCVKFPSFWERAIPNSAMLRELVGLMASGEAKTVRRTLTLMTIPMGQTKSPTGQMVASNSSPFVDAPLAKRMDEASQLAKAHISEKIETASVNRAPFINAAGILKVTAQMLAPKLDQMATVGPTGKPIWKGSTVIEVIHQAMRVVSGSFVAPKDRPQAAEGFGKAVEQHNTANPSFPLNLATHGGLWSISPAPGKTAPDAKKALLEVETHSGNNSPLSILLRSNGSSDKKTVADANQAVANILTKGRSNRMRIHIWCGLLASAFEGDEKRAAISNEANVVSTKFKVMWDTVSKLREQSGTGFDARPTYEAHMAAIWPTIDSIRQKLEKAPLTAEELGKIRAISEDRIIRGLAREAMDPFIQSKGSNDQIEQKRNVTTFVVLSMVLRTLRTALSKELEQSRLKLDVSPARPALPAPKQDNALQTPAMT